MKFEDSWKLLQEKLSTPQVVRNWTRAKGYFGEDFTAEYHDNQVTCTLPDDKEIKVLQNDFESIFAKWDEYLSDSVSRSELTTISFNTKYVISIFHQYLS